MDVEPHFVVPDAARAAAWYERAFGAREQSRVPVLGAAVHHQLADQFWGERHGQLTYPFGHRWNIAQRIRDVPDEEIARAAAEAFV
jgi:uncharacterized glyoxalase superfamily protein PhnB